MGKRQIGELQISEFIVTLLLSEIAATPIVNRTVPFLHAVIAVLILLSLEVIISYILLKSTALKKLFNGVPTYLIRRGKIVQKELSRNRIDLEELLAELRLCGYADPAEIAYAILEANGKLSVFPAAAKAPLTPSDMNLTPQEPGIAHILVADGQILPNNLAPCGWDEKRLNTELKRRKVTLGDVYLLTVDDAGTVGFTKKEGT